MTRTRYLKQQKRSSGGALEEWGRGPNRKRCGTTSLPPAESRGQQTARAVLGARERSERGETSASILVCGCLYLTIATLNRHF